MGGAVASVLRPTRATADSMPLVALLSERSLPPRYVDALRRGLTERGWVPGRRIRFELRSADGDLDRLPGLASELVALGATVIVTGLGTPAALAAKQATAKIPIVFVTGGDPVEFGIVANRTRPQGNVTGFGGEIAAIQKRIDLLREVSPRAKRVAFLRNLVNPIHPRIFLATERVATQRGFALEEFGVFEISELAGVFSRLQGRRFDALVVASDAMFSRHRGVLVGLAADAKLPAIYGDRLFPDAGGLMSFSADLIEMCARAAGYVDRILRGARPGDLPIGDAARFEIVINLETARRLGVTIPPALRQRAELVE